jgi:hypothetical protein
VRAYQKKVEGQERERWRGRKAKGKKEEVEREGLFCLLPFNFFLGSVTPIL